MSKMEKKDSLELLLSILKEKGSLSDIEKDILSSLNSLLSRPFDRQAAEQKVKENDAKYPEVYIAISSRPDTVLKRFEVVSDEDVYHNLELQVRVLCMKAGLGM